MSDLRYQVDVRFAQANLESVRAAAAREGMSLEQWVMQAAHDAAAEEQRRDQEQLLGQASHASVDVRLGDEAAEVVKRAAMRAGLSVSQWVSKTVAGRAAVAEHVGRLPLPSKTAFQHHLAEVFAAAKPEAKEAEAAIYRRVLGEAIGAVTKDLPRLEWSVPHRWIALGLHGRVNPGTHNVDERYRVVRAWAERFGSGQITIDYLDDVTIDARIAIEGQRASVRAIIWTPDSGQPRPRLRNVRAAFNPGQAPPSVAELVERYRACHKPGRELDYYTAELRELAGEITDRLSELPEADQDGWHELLAQHPAPQ